MAGLVNPISQRNLQIVKANPTRFPIILDDDCSSLTPWTVTGTVTVTDGKFVFAASSNIVRQLTFPKTIPFLITCEINATDAANPWIYILDSANTVIGAVGLYTPTQAYLYEPSGGNQYSTIITNTQTNRLYLLYDPTTNTCRGWVQYNGTGGPRYIGEINVTGIPNKIKFLRGSISSGTVSIDNIIITPSYGAVIGDSRVAGHATNGYDPWPGYYPDTFYPHMAFPYCFYKQTDVYLINGGVGSTNSAQNLARLTAILNFKPKLVVIGPSNLGEAIGTFKANHATMINQAVASGAKVVVLDLLPSQVEYAADIADFNSWLSVYCQDIGVTMVPVHDKFTTNSLLKTVFDSGDGVHLNELGARYLAELLADYIA